MQIKMSLVSFIEKGHLVDFRLARVVVDKGLITHNFCGHTNKFFKPLGIKYKLNIFKIIKEAFLGHRVITRIVPGRN